MNRRALLQGLLGLPAVVGLPKVFAGNPLADRLVTGSITAEYITAGSIIATKLDADAVRMSDEFYANLQRERDAHPIRSHLFVVDEKIVLEPRA